MRSETRQLIRGFWLLLLVALVVGCTVQTKGEGPPKAVAATDHKTEIKPGPEQPSAPFTVNKASITMPPGDEVPRTNPPAAEGGEWGNVKGRIIWGGDKNPEVKDIAVGSHVGCLTDNPVADKVKGTIPDENFIVNAKNKGLKNVFVYFLLQPGEKIAINPKLQKFAPEVVIDQPHCMFWPRALAMREGQVFVVKNTSQMQHNIRWLGDETVNKGGSVIINPGDRFEVKDLKTQKLPLALECNIHGWMRGRLAVLNHPYFTITDDDGKFEIKDAPVGDHKLMIYHEEIGYRLGAKGKNGEDIKVTPAGLDLKELKMGK